MIMLLSKIGCAMLLVFGIVLMLGGFGALGNNLTYGLTCMITGALLVWGAAILYED